MGLLNNESFSARNEKTAQIQAIVEYFRINHSTDLVQQIVADINEGYKGSRTKTGIPNGSASFSDDGQTGIEKLDLFSTDTEGYEMFTNMIIDQMTAYDPSYDYSIAFLHYSRHYEQPNDRGPAECCPHFNVCIEAAPKPTYGEVASSIEGQDGYWEDEDSFLSLEQRLEDYPSIPSRELIEFELENYDRSFEYELEENPDATISEDAAYWDDMNVLHHWALKRYRGKQDHLLEKLLGLQPGQLMYSSPNPRELK